MIKNKKGFTLIELIIVMAIIGILAVVAIVAISGKSKDARDARRLADMSAVRTAFALHCAESSVTTLGLTGTAVRPLVSSTAPSSYMNFTNVVDPNGSGACAESSGTAPCNYAYGQAANGSAWASGSEPTTIDTCNYWINFWLEGGTMTSGHGQARDEGLVTP